MDAITVPANPYESTDKRSRHLEAIVLSSVGEKLTACRTVRQCLSVSQSTGYIRTFELSGNSAWPRTSRARRTSPAVASPATPPLPAGVGLIQPGSVVLWRDFFLLISQLPTRLLTPHHLLAHSMHISVACSRHSIIPTHFRLFSYPFFVCRGYFCLYSRHPRTFNLHTGRSGLSSPFCTSYGPS
jgi:hypothetical protein